MKISVAQIHPVAGNSAQTIDKVAELTRQAASQGSRLIAFAECLLTGGAFDIVQQPVARRVCAQREFIKLAPPAQRTPPKACSAPLMAARCCSTRSANCRCPCNRRWSEACSAQNPSCYEGDG